MAPFGNRFGSRGNWIWRAAILPAAVTTCACLAAQLWRDNRRVADAVSGRMAAAWLTTILFSISAVCANRSTRLLGGTEANLARLLLATLLLALWAHGLGGGVSGMAFSWFLLSGLVGFGVGDLALYHAFPRLGARLTVLLAQCLAAPLAAVIEWIWLGTSLSHRQMLCGFTILAGVAIALLPERRREPATGSVFWGVCFGLLAAAGQGGGAVLSRKAFAVASIAGQTIDAGTSAYQRILGGLGLTLLFTAVIKRDRLWSSWSSRRDQQAEPMGRTRNVWRAAGPWILFNSLAGPVLGVTCYQWALATFPTGIVLPIVATTPLVVIPIARLTDGERAGVRSIIGGVIAVLGAVALTWTN